jgi:hypothetical protein
MTASDFFRTWSALLRIFPAFIVVGLLLKVATGAWRNRRLRLDPAHWRFAGGAVMALALLLPLSFAAGGDRTGAFSAWRGFIQNSEKLMASPLTDYVGLPVVVSFDPATRSERVEKYWLDSPWDTWKEGRRQIFHERRALCWGLVAAFVVLLGMAVQRQPDWVALVLGIGLIPFCTELTCYYYGILLGLLSSGPDIQLPASGWPQRLSCLGSSPGLCPPATIDSL